MKNCIELSALERLRATVLKRVGVEGLRSLARGMEARLMAGRLRPG